MNIPTIDGSKNIGRGIKPKMKSLKSRYTKKQALLNYLGSEIRLRELMQFLERFAEPLGDNNLQVRLDVLSPDRAPTFTVCELKVGPHRNGTYYPVCRLPLPLG